MLVVAKQKEIIALKIENSAEFYIEIGRFLDEQNYQFVENEAFCHKDFVIIDNCGNIIKTKHDDYILIDYKTGRFLAYVKKEDFEDNYIELKEEF